MIIDIVLSLPSKSMSLQSKKNESLFFPHHLLREAFIVMWEHIVEIIWRKAINLSVHGTMATYRKVNVQYLLWICVHTFWLRGSYTLYDFLITCNKFLWCTLDKFVMSVKYQIFIWTMQLYHCHGESNSVDSKFIAFLAWQTQEVLYIMWQCLSYRAETSLPRTLYIIITSPPRWKCSRNTIQSAQVY